MINLYEAGPIDITEATTIFLDFNGNDTSGLISIYNMGVSAVILSGDNITFSPGVTSITIPADSAMTISFANAHTLTLSSSAVGSTASMIQAPFHLLNVLPRHHHHLHQSRPPRRNRLAYSLWKLLM